jgi:hypothetical protein
MPDPARVTVTLALNPAAEALLLAAAQAQVPALKLLTDLSLQPGQVSVTGKLAGQAVEGRLVLETEGG